MDHLFHKWFGYQLPGTVSEVCWSSGLALQRAIKLITEPAHSFLHRRPKVTQDNNNLRAFLLSEKYKKSSSRCSWKP